MKNSPTIMLHWLRYVIFFKFRDRSEIITGGEGLFNLGGGALPYINLGKELPTQSPNGIVTFTLSCHVLY